MGVHVTVVCPGWVRTEFFDHTNDTKVKYSPKSYKPMTEPKDVVKRALKHASSIGRTSLSFFAQVRLVSFQSLNLADAALNRVKKSLSRA